MLDKQLIAHPVSDYLCEKTFGDVIDQHYPQISEQLISKEAFSLLKKHADLFPLFLSNFLCLEIPLYTDEKIADFLFCINDPRICNDYFSRKGCIYKERRTTVNSFYQGISDLSRFWNTEEHLLFNQVINIWLEYDYVDISNAPSVPNFFYAPRPRMNSLMMVHVTDVVFKTITGDHLPTKAGRFLLECLYRLPAEGWISQVGKMFARESDTLRLFIQQIPLHGISPYLQKIGYKYINDDRFISLLQNCYTRADQVDLDIDIAETIGKTIGLECSFNSTGKALRFLEYLLAIQVCPIDKYEPLYSFLQNINQKAEYDYQPFISHIKIVFHPDKKVIAKVYTGFAFGEVAGQIIRAQHY